MTQQDPEFLRFSPCSVTVRSINPEMFLLLLEFCNIQVWIARKEIPEKLKSETVSSVYHVI